MFNSNENHKVWLKTESNRRSCSYQRVTSAVAQLFVSSCLLTWGCGREPPPTPRVSFADYVTEKEMIENFIGVELPLSVRNCRYHSRSYGMDSGGTAWFFFESPRADMLRILDASQILPDASKLSGNPGARENIERTMKQTGESLTWWKPLELQNRRYATRVIENLDLVWSRQVDICAGVIRDDLMGVYLVYHCD
jgi:hypothetical protein